MLDAKIIGKRLRELRGNISQEKVAKACEIPVIVLNMYERGERIPRDEIKLKLAAFYNVKVENIF